MTNAVGLTPAGTSRSGPGLRRGARGFPQGRPKGAINRLYSAGSVDDRRGHPDAVRRTGSHPTAENHRGAVAKELPMDRCPLRAAGFTLSGGESDD